MLLPFKLKQQLQGINTFQEGDKLVAAEAERFQLPPVLARHFYWYEVLGNNPQIALEQINLPIAYTPTIAAAVIFEDILRRFSDPALNPHIFSYDQALMDRLKSGEKQEEEIIATYADELFSRIGNIYDHYNPDKKWEDLSEEEKQKHLAKMVVADSDNGRVLGIGDWGGNARIAKGKIACYFYGADGGFLPEELMAVGVDVGTDNQKLLGDSKYDGLHQPRKKGEDYYHFMQLALKAIDRLGIGTFQFEDFQGEQAWELLSWARENLRNTYVFNGDIEGTASMTMAALLTAESRGINLENSWYVFDGAGGAASGCKQQLLWKIEANLQKAGVSKIQIQEKMKKAEQRMVFSDSDGVLYQERKGKKDRGGRQFYEFQQQHRLIMNDEEQISNLQSFMESKGMIFGDKLSLEQYMDFVKQEQSQGAMKLGEGGSVFLYGSSTQPGTMSENLIKAARTMVDAAGDTFKDKEIVVFGNSNPTDKTDFLTVEESQEYAKKETTVRRKQQILRGALERVINAANRCVLIATGSPFLDVNVGDREYIIGQGNNVFIFPGAGLGVSLAQSFGISLSSLVSKGYNQQEIWKGIWGVASQALFNWYKKFQRDRFNRGALMPKDNDIPAVTKFIGIRVAQKLAQLAELDLQEHDFANCYNQQVAALNKRRYPPEFTVAQNAAEATLNMLDYLAENWGWVKHRLQD